MRNERQSTEEATPAGGRTGFLRRHRPAIQLISVVVAAIGSTATFVGVLVTAGQGEILAAQLEHELSRPVLEGSVSLQIASRELGETQSEIIDDLFASVYELAEGDAVSPYSTLAEGTLPISRSIPPVSVDVVVTLKNTGNDIATGVGLSVDWVRNITDVSVVALSEWEITSGGLGERGIVLSIGRIFQAETVEVAVSYEPTEDAADTLELTSQFEFVVVPGQSAVPYELLMAHVASNETPMVQLPLSAVISERIDMNYLERITEYTVLINESQ
jgi:hypothetical protein